MTRALLMCVLIAAVLATSISSALPAQEAHAMGREARTAADAGICGDAGTPEGAIVRYYLALDQRQFRSAYNCRGTDFQQSHTYTSFVRGFASTVFSHLLVADRLSNGNVAIVLLALDRKGAGLVQSKYAGQWSVGSDGQLAQSQIRLVQQYSVMSPQYPGFRSVLASDNQTVTDHAHTDVTGDGIADDLYATSGVNGHQVWVFSGHRLVFAETLQEVDGLQPGSDNASFVIQTAASDEVWTWNQGGFVSGPADPSRAVLAIVNDNACADLTSARCPVTDQLRQRLEEDPTSGPGGGFDPFCRCQNSAETDVTLISATDTDALVTVTWAFQPPYTIDFQVVKSNMGWLVDDTNCDDEPYTSLYNDPVTGCSA
jgi:hypothetical protein